MDGLVPVPVPIRIQFLQTQKDSIVLKLATKSVSVSLSLRQPLSRTCQRPWVGQSRLCSAGHHYIRRTVSERRPVISTVASQLGERQTKGGKWCSPHAAPAAAPASSKAPRNTIWSTLCACLMMMTVILIPLHSCGLPPQFDIYRTHMPLITLASTGCTIGCSRRTYTQVGSTFHRGNPAHHIGHMRCSYRH